MADDDSPPDWEDEDRAAILTRRNLFIAAALTGLGALGACSDSHGPGGMDTGPAVCLSRVFDSSVVDTSPMPCLGVPLEDSGADAPPMPCLDVVPLDSGASDTGPTVCLSMALPDSGADDAGDSGPDAPPMPCLSPPA